MIMVLHYSTLSENILKNYFATFLFEEMLFLSDFRLSHRQYSTLFFSVIKMPQAWPIREKLMEPLATDAMLAQLFSVSLKVTS